MGMDIDEMIAQKMDSIKSLSNIHHTTKCIACNDIGYIITTDENGNEYARMCDCKKSEIAIDRMKRSGIAEDELKKGFNDFLTFDNANLKNVKNIAIKYLVDFDKIKNQRANSIILTGAVGRGKTTLGMAIANNMMKQLNIAVTYMQYREVVTYIKQIMTDRFEYKNTLDKYRKAQVLYIDDLFKGKLTEADVNIVYEIMNYRYINALPTILSTEKSLNQIMQFDEAVGSRLIEMTKGYIAEFSDKIPNFRLLQNR